MHKHEVEDTKKRSLLKALTGNGLEVIFDTLIFGIVFVSLGLDIGHATGLGLGLSIMIELLCFVTNYFNDRIWNRLQWGRRVKNVDMFPSIRIPKPLTKEQIKAINDELALWEKASDEAWAKIDDDWTPDKSQVMTVEESLKKSEKEKKNA